MIAIIETSFLYALVDKNDSRHKEAAEIILQKAKKYTLVVPLICINETCRLINSNMSVEVEHAFLNGVIKDFNIEFLCHDDIKRSLEIMARFEKQQISFYEACITAFSEKLKTNFILGFGLSRLENIAPYGFDNFKFNDF